MATKLRSTRGRKFGFNAVLLIAVSPFALMSGPAFAQSASAPSQTAEIEFNIPPQPLVDALRAFSQVTGIQAVYTTSVGSGVASPGVKGRLPVSAALSKILSGSGLTYRFTGPQSVTLEPAPRTAGAIQLGPVRVEGSGVAASASEILTPKTDRAATDRSHSYAARAATVAGKAPESLRDIPQSVSVVTRQQMNDMNAVTVEQVLRQTTGVTSAPLSNLAGFFYVRGYSAQVQYDGIPSNAGISNVSQFDSALYDRVEVLRGPSGLFQGAGEPAGTVNLVRKRPHDTFGWAGSLMGGSWNNFHGDVDVTGPLNNSATIRGRVVVAGGDRDFFVDHTHERHETIYGVIEADLDNATTLTFSGTNEDKRITGLNFGQTIYSNGQFLNAPRSTYFGVKGTQTYTHQQEAYASLDHKFGGDWALRASMEYRHQSSNGATNSVYGLVNPDNSGARLSYSNGPAHTDSFTADVNLHGPINLFGRTHTLLLGANYAYWDTANFGGQQLFPLANIYDIDVPLQHIPLSYGSDSRSVQYGAYAQARISIADPLTVVAGARITNYRNKYRSGYPTYGAWEPDPNVNGHFTPNVGILYDITHQITLYGSYATIFVPQSGDLVFGGGSIKPRTGGQFEIGAKGSFLNGALNVSAALFNLTDRNRAVEDLEHTGTVIYYVAAGKVRSRGAEVELSGEILPGWSVFAGYTYLETKYLDDPDNLGLVYNLEEPKHSFKAWTTYRFGSPDRSGWQIGGGLRAQSKTSRGGPFQPAYAVADMQVGYRLNEKWSATLTVNNVFDKKYYIRVPARLYGNYGDPRSFTVTLRKTF